MEQIKTHGGLLVALILLVIMSLSCHISKIIKNFKNNEKNIEHRKHFKNNNTIEQIFMNKEKQKKESFYDNLNNDKFNKIKYLDLDKCVGLPCSNVLEESHPDIPCNIYKKCSQSYSNNSNNNLLLDGLTDEQKKILYLTLFVESGIESMGRNNESI